ncbi:AaceriAGL110Cp [[Ashbya] aceris (nom. inval.)]|nr:AaceriAGL110Cp [[Ashbya] aceris (nom. inval.)]
MLVIGLTGGIACGKSTVSRRLHERYRIPVIDADAIAREIMRPGERAYQKVVERFQQRVPQLVQANGELNRAALGAWIFQHAEERKALNAITHPEIRKRIFFRVVECYMRMHPMCVLDIPLLFETGLDVFCGVTVSVVCDQKVQIERLLLRNAELTREEAEARIRAQMSMEERIELSDYVIPNNDNYEVLFDTVDQAVTYIKPYLLTVILHYFLPFGIVSALAVVLSKYYKKTVAGTSRRKRRKAKELAAKKLAAEQKAALKVSRPPLYKRLLSRKAD